jgi:hypothetical protein
MPLRFPRSRLDSRPRSAVRTHLEGLKVIGPVLDAPIVEDLVDWTFSLNQRLPTLAKAGKLAESGTSSGNLLELELELELDLELAELCACVSLALPGSSTQ